MVSTCQGAKCKWPLLLALLATCFSRLCDGFTDGEFVQTARKAQFHQTRTHWHDLLGHHCPRFGHDRVVAVPIPKPQQPLVAGDDYKIQLSFDGDRHVTPWLPIIGKKAPEVPLVVVQLRRSGEEILGVTAKVQDVPHHYKVQHAQLVKEFSNYTNWPKHLLVRYTWETENDVDLDRGLYVLFIIGLVIATVLFGNAMRGVQPKLAAFLQEMAGEDLSVANGPAAWKGSAKAE